jgi:transposase-like protein
MAAITSIAEKFGVGSETLRKWVRRAEVDDGMRPGVTSAEAQRIKELERENRELRRANEILKAAAELSTRQRDSSWLIDDLRSCDGESAEGVFGGRAARAVGAVAAW